MNKSEIREPTQKRSIETKEKIIEAGFNLICHDGYYNTNTAKIAKEANVSTGIIYQYFKNKHDIFIAGLDKYADTIFYPYLDINEATKIDSLSDFFSKLIKENIENHKLSQEAHEEIMAMTHSDKDVAYYYYKREMDITKKISELLMYNGYNFNNINERVHLIIGIIENLCHEVIYHKHSSINYENMTSLVVNTIVNILS